MSERSDNLLEAALNYASKGWRVIPLHSRRDDGACDCGRTGCSSIAKHPRTPRGLHDATSDPDQIRDRWIRWPDANIAIACRPSGIVVVDVDPRNGGDETLANLTSKFGALPATLVADTGGGGQHYVFQHPGVKLPAHLGPGIDVKDDGYIVVEPSVHASGTRYAWRNLDDPVAELPAWISEMVRPEPSVEVEANGNKISHGRNNALTSLAGSMRAKGMSAEAIEAALLAENSARCDPPLDQEEVRKIAKGILRYPSGDAGATGEEGVPAKLRTLQWGEVVQLSYDDPPKHYVEGLVPANAITNIIGFAGVGKSLFALELAMAIHRGELFLGRFRTIRARVGILDEESAPQLLGSRLVLLAIGHGIDPQDPDLPCFSVANGARLDTANGVAAIEAWILENSIELLIVDTQRRLAPELKENESDDMALLARNVKGLVQRTKVSVLLIHHSRKNGQGVDASQMARGSGDIMAFIDSGIYLERKDGTVRVTHAKVRWTVPVERFAFSIDQDDQGGLRLAPVEIEETSAPTRKVDTAMLHITMELEKAPAKRLSRESCIDVVKRLGISKGTAVEALRRLEGAGKVTKIPKGKEIDFQLTAEGAIPF